MSLHLTLQGSKELGADNGVKSNFGYAVSNAGDLNMDGYPGKLYRSCW